MPYTWSSLPSLLMAFIESGKTPRRLPWARVAASWLRWGAQGVATAAPVSSLLWQRSGVRLQSRKLDGPVLAQQSKGNSAPEGDPGELQEGARHSIASDPISNGQIKASAAARKVPKLHFCEDTNEPEDVCNAQWLVLWSFASYAPERPSEEEQSLLRSFFEFFPDQCTKGPSANCYSEAVRASPPRVSDRRELLLWLCMVENQCRFKAGMPPKRCRHRELLRRWRYTDGYI